MLQTTAKKSTNSIWIGGDISTVAISKHIMFFLLFLIISPFAKDASDLGVRFADSDLKNVEDLFVVMRYEGVYGKKIEFNSPGFHIFMRMLISDKSGRVEEGDVFYGFVPDGTEEIQMFRIPIIPLDGGPADAKWLECNNQIIQRHADVVNRRCTGMLLIPHDLYQLIQSFVKEKRLSMYDGLGLYGGRGLRILYVDKMGKKTLFEMLHPIDFQDYFVPNDFIADYIKLYDGLSKLMMSGFAECRWSNLGNARELMAKCKEWSGSLFFDKDALRQVMEDAR